MRSSPLAFAVVPALAVGALAACTVATLPTTQSDAGGSTGGAEVQPHCYLAVDGKACECTASNEDATRAASDWKKVDACNASSAGASLACQTDTKVDGTSTVCNCLPLGCANGDNRCSCGPGSTPALTECTGWEWCCGADDGSQCYCSTGAFGSGCANGEHTVSSCKLSDTKLPSDQRDSCDGLKFVTPS